MPAMTRNNTKDQLADAFLEQLREGVPINKIRIRSLTEACKLDRQTFYYHFKNIQELSIYVYDRNLKSVFGNADDPVGAWKENTLSILENMSSQHDLRETIAPILGEERMRKELLARMRAEVELVFLPRLVDAGMPKDDARQRTHFVAYLLESILTGWITKDIDESPIDILDHIEEMLNDYAAGVKLRLGKTK